MIPTLGSLAYVIFWTICARWHDIRLINTDMKNEIINLGSLEIFRLETTNETAKLERLVQPETWAELASGPLLHVHQILANQVFQTLSPKSEEHCQRIIEKFDLPFSALTLWNSGELKFASFDRFELSMYSDDAIRCAQAGQDSGDSNERNCCEWIVNNQHQLDQIDKTKIRLELKEYGAWDDEELDDEELNEIRIVLIAANNIREEYDI